MKFALIGKNIKHSRSPEMYEQITGQPLDYDILDIDSEDKLPSIEELKSKYRGVNITSPYKTNYLKDVVFESPFEYKEAINAICFYPNKIVGTNTDAVAIELEIMGLKKSFPDLFFVILGDGVMSQLTTSILDQKKMNYEVLSRKRNGDISQANLSDYVKKIDQVVIINTCSRDFVFTGVLHSSFIFWDYNYSFIPHQNTLPSQVKYYHDGQRMLELQAIAAAKFWKII
jgi:shikimate dehydrogenase